MRFSLLVVCLFGLNGAAQGQAPVDWPLHPLTHRIRYVAFVPVAGSSQADLLARARGWAAGVVPLHPALITRLADTDVLVVSGTRPFAYTYVLTGTTPPRSHTDHLVLHYTATLSLWEGRYRYEVTELDFAYPSAKPPSSTRLPAEIDLMEATALTDNGAIRLAAVRTAFQTVIVQLLAQLQEALNTPQGKAAIK